ncbi:MAG: hypothetical protein AMXMBFR84_05750 [Candidatus Hydrogenedentota bacterium]
MMNCDQVRVTIAALFDADEPMLPEVDSHLAVCPGCAAYLDRLAAVDDALLHLELEPVRRELVTAVQARIASEAGRYRVRNVTIAIVATIVLSGAAMAGWFYPGAAEPAVWWSWINQTFAITLVATPQYSIGDLAVELQNLLDTFFRAVPTISNGLLVSALVSAAGVLAIVNGIEVVRIRASGALTRDVSRWGAR